MWCFEWKCVLLFVVLLFIGSYGEYIENTDKSYQFYDKATTWQEAREACALDNTILAMPKNEDDVNAILITSKHKNVFVGMHSIFNKWEYVTLNGKPMQYYYNIWDPNYDHGKNCIILNSSGKLSGQKCDSKEAYVCEKDSLVKKNKPHNTIKEIECLTDDEEYKLAKYVNKCYKIHMNLRSWAEARAICEAESGKLAVIRNKMEENAVLNMFGSQAKYAGKYGQFPDNAFLGVHDLFQNKKFMTVYNENYKDVGYGDWDSSKSVEHCLSIDRKGKFSDLKCEIPAFFICEQKVITQLGTPVPLQDKYDRINVQSFHNYVIHNITTFTVNSG